MAAMTRRTRRLLLLLIAVLLPAIVLVALTTRFVRQEHALAEQRAIDRRHAAVEQFRRELSAMLRAITLQERLDRPEGLPRQTARSGEVNAAVVTVTPLEGDSFVPPWEPAPRVDSLSPAFLRIRKEGEFHEFQAKNLAEAQSRYRSSWEQATNPHEKCEARLLEGRVLSKIAQKDGAQILKAKASQHYRKMFAECSELRDEAGIPYRLYAADRLLELKTSDLSYVEGYLIEAGNSSDWQPPVQAHMVQTLLKRMSSAGAVEAEKHIAVRIRDSERLEAIRREFAALRPQADKTWVAYGSDHPLLIRVVPSETIWAGHLLVVAADRLAPSGVSFVTSETESSVALGNEFPGLYVEWSPAGTLLAVDDVSDSFYLGGIGLILLATILSGFLLQRDVNRDIRMAEMRAYFVAGVSHELKTPLTAIRMFAETIAIGRTQDERKRQEYMETIVNESERLTRLVDNVLDFSKIEQGKKLYTMKPTALPEVVRSAARAMQYPLSQQGFTLNVAVDENVAPVQADADAIEQAILNLLSNAMKYSGTARQVELSLASQNGSAVIEVRDNGLGIAAADRERIFEKFYRVHSPETGLIAGAGLGLTLVKHIAEAHNGSVEVHGEIGRGSTFSMRIPTASEEMPA
jgi:signal transduction histidine kinase